MSLPGLPEHAQHLAPFFELSAAEFCLEPYLLAAVCSRESDFGRALDASGTGDQQSRDAGAIRHGVPTRLVSTQPPLVMPLDGLGWGRGLMQLDWAAHPELWRTDTWREPSWNIHRGAHVLWSALEDLEHDEFAALAAYNAGVGRIKRALTTCEHLPELQRQHILDSYTTGRDYAADCLRRRDQFLAIEAGISKGAA